MSIEDKVKAVAQFLPWVTAVIGWLVGLTQWKKKCRAEAELKLIRRRGEAPYFVPSNRTFNNLYLSAKAGQITYFPAGSGNVLCWIRDEIDKATAAETPVVFVVENDGQSARRISVLLDGTPIRLAQEPETSAAHGLQFLEYPYHLLKHGQTQHLVISFETTSGIQDRHTYQLIHGVRSLRRIDPP